MDGSALVLPISVHGLLRHHQSRPGLDHEPTRSDGLVLIITRHLHASADLHPMGQVRASWHRELNRLSLSCES